MGKRVIRSGLVQGLGQVQKIRHPSFSIRSLEIQRDCSGLAEQLAQGDVNTLLSPSLETITEISDPTGPFFGLILPGLKVIARPAQKTGRQSPFDGTLASRVHDTLENPEEFFGLGRVKQTDVGENDGGQSALAKIIPHLRRLEISPDEDRQVIGPDFASADESNLKQAMNFVGHVSLMAS